MTGNVGGERWETEGVVPNGQRHQPRDRQDLSFYITVDWGVGQKKKKKAGRSKTFLQLLEPVMDSFLFYIDWWNDLKKTIK